MRYVGETCLQRRQVEGAWTPMKRGVRERLPSVTPQTAIPLAA
jgi:hypothetical protein